MATIDDIFAKIRELSSYLDQIRNMSISSNQILVNYLSDISQNAGLLTSGEFRSGNGKEPGQGFSGVRIVYPPVTYDGEQFNIIGVNNDTLQAGISATDGTIKAGGGLIIIDRDGIYSNSYDATSGAAGFIINPDGSIVAQNAKIRGTIETAVFETEKVSVQSGTQWVSEGSALAAALTDSDTTIIVNEGVFRMNDFVRLKNGTNDEWLLVLDDGYSSGGTVSYTVTRGLGGSSFAFEVGQAVVRMGQVAAAASSPSTIGSSTAVTMGALDSLDFGGTSESLTGGFLVLEGGRENGPYFGVTNRYGSTYNEITDVVRLGYLQGFIGQGDVYGIAIGDTNRNFIYNPTDGMIIKTTSNNVYIDDDGFFTDIANLYKQSSKPTAPETGYISLYFKTDGKLYKQTEAGTETEVGTSLTKASASDVTTGTDDAKYVTSLALKDAGIVPVDLISSVPHKQMWIGSAKPTLTNGCGAPGQIEMGTNKNVYDYLPFDKDSIEYAYANIVMPQDYTGGTVYALFHWTHPSTTTNFKVSWGLQGVCITDDDTLDVAQGTAIYSNDTGGTTSDLYISPLSSAITLSGTPAAGKMCNFRISRKADDATNDTLAVDAYLLGVVLYYPVG